MGSRAKRQSLTTRLASKSPEVVLLCGVFKLSTLPTRIANRFEACRVFSALLTCLSADATVCSLRAWRGEAHKVCPQATSDVDGTRDTCTARQMVVEDSRENTASIKQK